MDDDYNSFLEKKIEEEEHKQTEKEEKNGINNMILMIITIS